MYRRMDEYIYICYTTVFVNYVISFKRHLNSIDQHQIVIFQTILNLLHSKTSNDFIGERDNTNTLVMCIIFSLESKSLQNKDKLTRSN